VTIAYLTFEADGRLTGSSHPNENGYSIDDTGAVSILSASKKPTCVLTPMPGRPDVLIGPFLGAGERDLVHFLHDPSEPGATTFDTAIVITGMSAERMAHAKEILARPEFSGATTHTLDCIKGREYYVPEWFQAPVHDRVGGFGCWVSQLLAVLWGLKRSKKAFLTLEDDVVFRAGWTDQLAAAVTEAPSNWAAIYLGVSPLIRPHYGSFSKTLARLHSGTGAYAILWSLAGAERASDLLRRNPMHADVVFNIRKDEMPVFAVRPPVVGVAGKLTSDTNPSRTFVTDQFWD
jgi:hypothetical protein